jgi:hypothetical protein
MANNLASNFTERLLKRFLPGFESSRVVTKTVDTNLIASAGSDNNAQVSVKRKHQYNTIRTSDGDLSSSSASDILSGKATADLQDYITVWIEFGGDEESLKLAQLDEILGTAPEDAANELEVSLADYMMKNCNLSYGDPDNVVDAWADVAGAGALCESVGVPNGEKFYVMDPFVRVNLAGVQQGLNPGGGDLVTTAWEDAQVTRDIGGLRCISSNALSSFTSALTDFAGAVNGAPTATYVGAKDTMTQSITVDGFNLAEVIKAGSIVEVTGPTRVNMRNGQAVVDQAGTPIPWRGVVTADVTLSAGAGTLVVAGPAIYEATGAYNTVNQAIADNDVITVLNGAAATYKPNLFYHRSAYGMTTVPVAKLHSTDTMVETVDGIRIRCHKYSDGTANTQKVRFDILPAFIANQPLWAGQGHGA